MQLFECVGIPFVSEDLTSRRLQQLVAEGTRDRRPEGGEMITWLDDASGAAMIFNTNEQGQIACARPAFQSGFDFIGVAQRFGADPDGCRFCDPVVATQPLQPGEWRAPGAEDYRSPFVFHLANSGMMRQHIAPNGPVDLIVAGFAEEIRIWRDEHEFRAQPGNENAPLRMTGAHFDPQNPSPSQYLLTGEVRSVEEQMNSATKTKFWVLVVDAPFVDNNCWLVLVRPDDAPFGIERGNVVETNVWACAMAMS
jgi:hypothetical protein